MSTHRNLTNILANGADDFKTRFESTTAAKDFEPLPAGEYECRIVKGTLETSRTKATPSFKLELQVIEGEHTGRKLWNDIWLTVAALPNTKRDLAKLGITALEQLEAPFPPGIVVKAKVVLLSNDDGTSYNKVRSFEVIRIEQPEAEPFAPSETEKPF